MKRTQGFVALLTLLPILAAGGSVAATPAPATLLDTLEHGLWQFRTIGGTPAGDGGVAPVCLGNPGHLVQIRHGAAPCAHFTVKSTPDQLIISYSCKGRGQGLTSIRKESPRIIHIQSQGILDSAPFSFSVEGRRSSNCSGENLSMAPTRRP